MSGDCGHGWGYHSGGAASPCDKCVEEEQRKKQKQQKAVKRGLESVQGRKELLNVLLTHGLTQGEVLEVMGARAENDAVRDLAKGIYANDDIEVDHKLMFSFGEDGCWVSAWVHVTNEELEAQGIVNPERQK